MPPRAETVGADPAGDQDGVPLSAPLVRAALESLGEGVIVQGPDSTILTANAAAPGILGLTRDQLLGRTSFDQRWRCVHRDGTDFPGEEHPAVVALREHRPVRDVVMGVDRPSGERAWLLVNAEPVIDNDGVDTGHIVCSFGDITAHLDADDRYRLLAEHVHDVVLLLDAEGEIRWASPSTAAALGWEPDELVGRRALPLLHPEDVDRMYDARARATESGEVGRVELRYATADGRWIWMSVTGTPLVDADGATQGDIVVLRDVQSEVRAREERRRSDERFRLALDAFREPFYIYEAVRDSYGEAVDLVYTHVNSAGAELIGLPPDEILGRSVLELFPSVVEQGILAAYLEPLATGRVSRLRVPEFDENGVTGAFDLEASRFGDDLVVVVARDITALLTERERTESAQAEVEQAYRLLLEFGAAIVFRGDGHGVLTWVGDTVTEVLGVTPQEMVGHPVLSFIHPDDHARVPDMARILAGEDQGGVDVRVRTRDGGYLWMETRARPVVDDAGEIVTVVGGWRDVDAVTRARSALAASETMLQTSVRAAAVGMALTDVHGRFSMVNPALARLVGYDEEWLLEHGVPDLVAPETDTAITIARQSLLDGEIESYEDELPLVRSDGGTAWARISAVLIRGDDDELLAILVQAVDVTAEHQAQEQLSYQAFHDALTGLRNRAWILDVLSVDLAAAARDGSRVGVFFIDLDNFKLVNDSLGHAAGDEVLTAVALRLRSALRPSDRVGRFGGDEFVVVVPHVGSLTDVEHVAARIRDSVAQEITVQGHRIVPTASIGIALSSAGSTAESLLRDTDSALFRAKSAGRARWHFFDEAMHEAAVARLTLEDDLRRALVDHEFVVHYQPIVRLSDRRVTGHEALVRWQHPERGLVPPIEFLPVAEESGLVVPLGRQVVEQVCARLAATPDLGPVSINQSAVEISAADWAERLLDTAHRHRVEPSRLVVEVTETAVLSMLDDARADLVGLRRLGVGIHVDDFGTGFSSISLLRDLPVTGLKLDAGFVRDLVDGDSPADALAAGVAGLATGLSLVSVAEGVETREQERILRAQGWSHAQGYLFGRPQPTPARDVL